MINCHKTYSLLLILLYTSCSGDSEMKGTDLEKKFKHIKTGMSEKEVIRILGTPKHKDIDSLSTNNIYYYYTTNPGNSMQSSPPVIVFDAAGKVKYASFGSGG